MKRGIKRFAFIAIASVFVIAAFSLWFTSWLSPNRPLIYGATFSTVYADYLGIDWRETYLESMDDLGIAAWRIPVYWSEIEWETGVYDWEALDWMMNEAKARDVGVTLAIGLKVPRWPECFLPAWSEDFSQEVFDEHALAFLEEVVERYKDHSALVRWQVENEPFFPFGDCPSVSPQRLTREFALVRSQDPDHPIQTTTSGEQSLWILSTSHADVLGVSVYREVYTPVIGSFVFPHTPLIYALQRVLAEPFVDKVIVSELQAEPWFDGGLYEQEVTIETLYASFPEEDLRANVAFAKNIGVDEVYFWGVEWWMYLKDQGDARLWDAARDTIGESL